MIRSHMISRYNMRPGEHRIFCRKYSMKTCFDEVDVRQNDTQTKSLFDEMARVFDEVSHIRLLSGHFWCVSLNIYCLGPKSG